MDDYELLERRGFWIRPDFFGLEWCAGVLTSVQEHRDRHPRRRIERRDRRRPLRYEVIDGRDVARDLPRLVALPDQIRAVMRQRLGLDVAPLANRAANVNVNVMSPGDTYRWHYDRNSITAIVFLNTVIGGEMELYGNYRARLPVATSSPVQRWVDWLYASRWARQALGEQTCIAPQPGTLLVMRGDRCLHAVRPVVEGERINVVMTFDVPGARFVTEENLDSYLYTPESALGFDPNYVPGGLTTRRSSRRRRGTL